MSTHNIGLNEEISKLSLNYHQISNTHLISSSLSSIGLILWPVGILYDFFDCFLCLSHVMRKPAFWRVFCIFKNKGAGLAIFCD